MEIENNGEDERSTCLWILPEGCIAEILALTSPPDVCRLSFVSKSIRSAADSDSVWEKFLPSDYQSILARSLTPIPHFSSKKEIYIYFCHHPLLIDEGRKSFSLEKWTGKKCYFLSARDLNFSRGETAEDWRWTSLPESRFPEVAVLKSVWWLGIWGTIRAGILSPQTSYKAYFVYKLKDHFGLDYLPSVVSVGISGVESEKRYVFLSPDGKCELEESPWTPREEIELTWDPLELFSKINESDIPLPKLRDDGWLEVEMGEFISENEDDCIEMRMQEADGGCVVKVGLIVEGIEIRPRMD